MDPQVVITGVAAFTAGAAALITCSALRIRRTLRLAEGHVWTLHRIAEAAMHNYRHLSGHEQREKALREENRMLGRSVAAYMEVIALQQEQIDNLATRDAERMQEIENLEIELAATKRALAREESDGDIYAEIARSLGYEGHAPAVAALGAAA